MRVGEPAGGARGFSRRALTVLGAFGLTTDDACAREPHRLRERTDRMARQVDSDTPAGTIVAIVGASGAGKSMLLNAIGDRVRERRGRAAAVARVVNVRGRVIDRIGRGRGCGPRELARSLAILGGAGLADARLMVAPVETLSEGERARLGLAIAIDILTDDDGTSRGTLIADEFGGTLDELALRALCATIARRVRRRGSRLRLIVATHRPEVIEGLRPDRVVRLELE